MQRAAILLLFVALAACGGATPDAQTTSSHGVRQPVLRAEGRPRGDGEEGSPSGGSKIGCTVALQPYLYDELRGDDVTLSADRYEVRTLETHVHAAPDGAGWIARGEPHLPLRFRYEVIDVRTGERVLEREATLVCQDPLDHVPPPLEPLALPPGWLNHGRYWLAFDALGMGGITLPVSNVKFLPATTAATHTGTTGAMVGLLQGFSTDLGPVHARLRGGIYFGGIAPAGCVRGCMWAYGLGEMSAGPLVRLGESWGIWAGPSLLLWSVSLDGGGKLVDGRANGALGAALGVRYRSRLPSAHRKRGSPLFFEWPIELTAPIVGGGAWLVTTGFSFAAPL